MWQRAAIGLLFVYAVGVSACDKDKPSASAPASATTPAAAKPPLARQARYVGRQACRECHAEQTEKWKKSHHARAMQKPSDSTVLGDFDDAKLRYFGKLTRFLKKEGQFIVHTAGADGEEQDFVVKYVFGFTPLQQYLVELEDGHIQALPFAWDSRPKSDGGQRWYHLYPDEAIEPGDPLHWTGPNQNWNFMCADCHSTNVEKGYDEKRNAYSTTYSEIDVSCETCHGPASNHVASAKAGKWEASKGFDRRVGKREGRIWAFVEGKDIAVMKAPGSSSDELSACAPCHSRRGHLGGTSLDYYDTYRLSLLDDPLYFADGQIRDEVYVTGSFLQSKMHAAGVVCSDCHDAHTNQLKHQGNTLCAQCHKNFDTETHHFHKPSSVGCVDCHMPTRTYMGVDERHDHRFGLPRPDLTAKLGVPNPCSKCHDKKDAEWASAQIIEHRGKQRPKEYASTFAAARNNRPEAARELLQLANDEQAPPIKRATAITELAHFSQRDLPRQLARLARDQSPLVRRAVAEVAGSLGAERGAPLATSLLGDGTRSVRIEAVGALLRIGDRRAWAKPSSALKTALDEYQASRLHNADRAEAQVDLALLAQLRGKASKTERRLRRAIQIDRSATIAYANLADLYRAQGKDAEAVKVLEEGLKLAADPPPLHHALGLALIRDKQSKRALQQLEKAWNLRSTDARFGYVYAVALFDNGSKEKALSLLEKIYEQFPNNVEVVSALVSYNQKLDHTDAARKFERVLRELQTN